MSNHHRLDVLGLRTLAGTPLNHSITSLFTYKSEDYIIKSHYIIHKRFEQLAIAFLRGFFFLPVREACTVLAVVSLLHMALVATLLNKKLSEN